MASSGQDSRVTTLTWAIVLAIGAIPAILLWVYHFRAVGVHGQAYDAAVSGQRQTVEALLDAGMQVDAPLRTRDNRMRHNLLMVAADQGHLELVRELIDRGADVNSQNPGGVPPLYLAAQSESMDIMALLLESGADVNARAWGPRQTSLDAAVGKDRLEAVRFLLDHGAETETSEPLDPNTLHIACGDHVSLEVFRLILANASDVNAQTYRHRTPLMLTIRTLGRATREEIPDQLEKMRLLLEAGANVDQRESTGRTALMLAIKTGLDAPVSILLEAGADPFASDIWGQSAIRAGVIDAPAPTVAKLLEAAGPMNEKTHASLEEAVDLRGDKDAAEVLELLKRSNPD